MKKLLPLMSLVVLASPNAFGLAELTQDLITNIPSSISLNAINQDASSGDINPLNGVINRNLSVSFEILTNGDDANYDYILSSSIASFEGDTISAYYKNGAQDCLALANTFNKPTLASINNLKSLTPAKNKNENIIGYPLHNIIQNLESITMQDSQEHKGMYYLIKVGDNQAGFVSQQLETKPLLNTYSYLDTAGLYQAVITLSAIRKP